jgi:hypothetical protein
MSDDFDDEDEDNESESSVIRDLRRQAREGKAAIAERDAAVRKLAFIEAGVPSTAATAYFVKGYDGELTPEAIKAAAVEAGFVEADKEPEPDPERKAEEDANGRLNDAVSGANDSAAPPGYEDELAAAKTPDEARAVMAKYKVPIVG